MKTLNSKFAIPETPPHLIKRPRLLDLFSRRRQASVIIVSAPAGYGKTSLAAQFLSTLPQNMKCWLNLEKQDAEPKIFAEHFLSALSEPMKKMKESGLSDLLRQGNFNVDNFIHDLCFFLEEYKGPRIWIVLDNWESVDQCKEIRRIVGGLIFNSKVRLKLVINSRVKPGIHLAKLRESGQAIFVTQDDLKFTRDELGEAIRLRSKIRLKENDLDQVYNITHGWCVNIGFIQEAIKQKGIKHGMELIANIKYSESILDYLNEEMLSNTSPEFRSFVAHCSILDEISRESCAVFYDDEKFIQDNLKALSNSSLPFITVGGSGIRLHPLVRASFNKILRNLLSSEELLPICKKASKYYLACGNLSSAINLLYDIQAYNEALEIINDQWFQLLAQNKLSIDIREFQGLK
jgi:LuxR family maltose regulon positive regulatory protein